MDEKQDTRIEAVEDNIGELKQVSGRIDERLTVIDDRLRFIVERRNP